MTVETNDTVERYTVSGVGPYAFSFRVFDQDEIAVTAISGAGVSTTLAITANYSVTGVDDEDGGAITLTAGTATTYAGYTLDIRSNTVEYQPTSIRNQGSFLSEVHENAFDRLSRQIQDLSRKVRGSLRYPDDGTTDGVAPSIAGRAGRYLSANTITGAFEWVTSIVSTALTQSIFNQYQADSDPYKRTAVESAAGVTPENYTYLPLDARRYGLSTAASATTNTTALNNASLVANTAGGGIVEIPEGTFSINGTLLFYASPNLGQVIFRGRGKVATTLSYTGSATAFGVSAASTRIYDCGIRDLTVVNAGSGTVGLDLDSVSTSSFEHVTITNFPTAARLHSTIEGGCLYTRWYDVTAQMNGSAVVGFNVDALASNATHFIACRYNGPNNTVGTAWKIVDALGVTVTDCDIDQVLVGFALTAPSGAGYTDYNIIKGNRIELCGTVYSIGANVRFTRIYGNTYQSNTTILSDSGTYTFFLDPPYTSAERYADTGSASGNRRFQNNADQGANPFVVIADNTASTAGAIALQIENTSAGGILAKGSVSGTEKFSIDSGGKLSIQQVVLKQVAPTVAASQIGLGSTTQTTVGAAGGASALPATPTGYLIINVAGTNRVIPYYAQA